MALSMSRKVNVKPGVISPSIPENFQNCLLLSDKNKFTNHEIIDFKNANEIKEFFGEDSEEYRFAVSYFKSYIGAAKTPSKLLIGENYSLEPLPFTITSTAFEESEKPEDKIKLIGSDDPQSSFVISQEFDSSEKEILENQLTDLSLDNTPSPSFISSLFFNDTKDQIFQKLKKIGQDEANKGDFNIVFKKEGGERITATVNNINLNNAGSFEDALQWITNSINPAIAENGNLGEDYKIEITFNETGEGSEFTLSTENKGSKYNIAEVFSTTPENSDDIENIARILKLDDASNPIKVPGDDGGNIDFKISFLKNSEFITARAQNLDFSGQGDLVSMLTYLQNKINESITNEPSLGENYKVAITKTDKDNDKFIITVKTNNTGVDYNITEISSTGSENTVASLLKLNKDNNPLIISGSDKKYGDFTIVFNIDGQEISATAQQLDFTSYTSINEQLIYLMSEINDVIYNTENLGETYTIAIEKDVRDQGRYVFVLKTTYYGAKYNIVRVFSTLPLNSDNIASILRLDDDSGPTKENGRDSVPLTEILDNYSDIRDDWWSVSIINPTLSLNNNVANWVSNKNNGCRYVFITYDNNINATKIKNNQDTFGYQIYNSGNKGTFVIYGNETHAGFVAGIAASIDYTKENGTITFSGKRQQDLELTVSTDDEADCLESNYYNYYGSYSFINQKYRCLENGIVSNGGDNQKWIDSLFNQIWLTRSLQIAMFNLLLDKNKISFNNTGYSLISSSCNDVINKGINNGTIVAGVNIDAYQTAIVNESVGKDVSNDLKENGFYLYIGDNDSSARLERKAKNCLLFYCDGGAIQKIEFTANVLL